MRILPADAPDGLPAGLVSGGDKQVCCVVEQELTSSAALVAGQEGCDILDAAAVHKGSRFDGQWTSIKLIVD